MSHMNQYQNPESNRRGRYPEFPVEPTGVVGANTTWFGGDFRGTQIPRPHNGPQQGSSGPAAMGTQAAPRMPHLRGPAAMYSDGSASMNPPPVQFGMYPHHQGMMYHEHLLRGPMPVPQALHRLGSGRRFSSPPVSVVSNVEQDMAFGRVAPYPHRPAYYPSWAQPSNILHPSQTGPGNQSSQYSDLNPHAFHPHGHYQSFQGYSQMTQPYVHNQQAHRPNSRSYGQSSQLYSNESAQAVNMLSLNTSNLTLRGNPTSHHPQGRHSESYLTRADSRSQHGSSQCQSRVTPVTDANRHETKAFEGPGTQSSRPLVPTAKPFQPLSVTVPPFATARQAQPPTGQDPVQPAVTTLPELSAQNTKVSVAQPFSGKVFEREDSPSARPTPTLPSLASQTQPMAVAGNSSITHVAGNKQQSSTMASQEEIPTSCMGLQLRQRDPRNADTMCVQTINQKGSNLAQVTDCTESTRQTPLTPQLEPVNPDKPPQDIRCARLDARASRLNQTDGKYLLAPPTYPTYPEKIQLPFVDPRTVDPNSDELVFGPYVGLLHPIPPFRDPEVMVPTPSPWRFDEPLAHSLMRAARKAAELCREDERATGRADVESEVLFGEMRHKLKGREAKRWKDEIHQTSRPDDTSVLGHPANQEVFPTPSLPNACPRANNTLYQAWLSTWEKAFHNMASYTNGYANYQAPFMSDTHGISEVHPSYYQPNSRGHGRSRWDSSPEAPAASWDNDDIRHGVLNTSSILPPHESVPGHHRSQARTEGSSSRSSVWSSEMAPDTLDRRIHDAEPHTPSNPPSPINAEDWPIVYLAPTEQLPREYHDNGTSEMTWRPTVRLTINSPVWPPLPARMGVSGNRNPIAPTRHMPFDTSQEGTSNAPTRSVSPNVTRSNILSAIAHDNEPLNQIGELHRQSLRNLPSEFN